MKLAAITGEKQVQLIDKPEPQPHGDIALVKVLVAPACTEYKMYAAGHQSECIGHEAAGEVAFIDKATKVKVGNRVVVMPQSACGYCELCATGDYIHCEHNRNLQNETQSVTGSATYAQYLLKPDWLLLPVPDEISLEHASMACCGLGPTFGAMQRLRVDAFDTVLITGMGPVGLGGVINGAHRGARVIAIESHPYRAKLASELGARAVINPHDPDALKHLRALTGGLGADKAIDCSGASSAQLLLIESVRRRGEVAFIGEGGNLTLHVSNHLLRKGLTLHGAWHWNRRDAARLWQIIKEQGAAIDQLITHRFALSQVRDAWELQLTGNCGKILLYPWKEN
jgi:L-iditol 2-dehydrogenase